MFKYRKLYKDIVEHLNRKEYSIITGARQTGKTTILMHLYDELLSQNKKVFYFNLEDPEILNEINQHPENIFKFCKKPANPLYDKSSKEEDKVFLLIDEVQYAQYPSKFLKYLYDTYLSNLKIIATGSSAFYMDKKFSDSLAGRKKIFQLWTLSFEELLYFKEESLLLKELDLIKQQPDYISKFHREMDELFTEYLIYGGYPAVVLESNINIKKEILNELKNSYIRRDLLETGISNESAFYQLITILSGQTGNIVNRNELSKTLRIDNKTIDNYLFILRKCFHIELISPFYNNIRKELIKMPKVYFNDLGLRNVFLNRFYKFDEREDKGAVLENYFYIKLKELYNSEIIKYWRTADGNEVDFIIQTDNDKGFAYEVKYNDANNNKSKYKKFTENYPGFKLNFVAYLSADKSKSILKF